MEPIKFQAKKSTVLLSLVPIFVLVLFASYNFLQYIELLGTKDEWRFHYSFIGFVIFFSIFFAAVMFWVIYFYLRRKGYFQTPFKDE